MWANMFIHIVFKKSKHLYLEFNTVLYHINHKLELLWR